jgi:pilus assembly protein FimV
MRAKPIHTISLLASALALALPTSSFALGLGRLTVESSLGQPLSAQIELNSASREELDSIAARIADPSLYRQNNLAYPAILTRARISVERAPSGQNVLRISTPAPVNEPYLDLLVELNWAAGRVVRSYTFLLDPPGMTAPTPVIEPVAPMRSGAAARPAAPTATIAPQPAAAARPQASGGAAGGSTYAVRRGDSLARIANQFRPDGVSLEQMLVALFNANPEAFEGNNMNRLRAGSILNIPGQDAAAQTNPNDALHQVRVQAADWRGYRDRVAATAPASEGAATRETTGRIGTAVQERTPEAQPGQDQVRVSREAVRSRTGAGGAPEDAVARDRAMQDAQARIAELEKTLRDLQRALEMRNPGMAQLQNRADAGKAGEPARLGTPANGSAGVAAGAGAVAPGAASKASEPVRAPDVMAKSGAPAGVVAPKGAEMPPPAAPTDATKTPTAATAPRPDAAPKTADATVSPSAATAAATAPAPSTPTPAPALAPSATAKAAAKSAKAESSGAMGFFEELIANPPTWMLAAGGAALLAAIAAIVASRRRKAGHFEDSIISGTDIKSNTVFGSTGGGIVNTGENSLATDFSHEGITQVDTDEVDPIAEAEVYLAYGRDAQAEEILKDALKKDPQRQEIYLKLLEIHAQHNKPTVFEQVATELYAVSKGQGETWQKAVALGRQLDPNNPLFAGEGSGSPGPGVAAAAAAGGAAAAAASAMHFVDSEDRLKRPPEPAAADKPPVPVGVAEIRGNDGLDFRLSDDISIAPTSSRRTVQQPEAVATAAVGHAEPSTSEVHFAGVGEPLHSAQEPKPSSALGERVEAARAADPGFDLDFHLDDSEKPTPLRASAADDVLPRAEPAPELARPQAAIDLDKLDLNFDRDRAPFEDPTPSVLDGQWHDAATKLDLAKAYQEMGDVEGAREILQEVLHEGDEGQRAEAGTLLEKLG